MKKVILSLVIISALSGISHAATYQSASAEIGSYENGMANANYYNGEANAAYDTAEKNYNDVASQKNPDPAALSAATDAVKATGENRSLTHSAVRAAESSLTAARTTLEEAKCQELTEQNIGQTYQQVEARDQAVMYGAMEQRDIAERRPGKSGSRRQRRATRAGCCGRS